MAEVRLKACDKCKRTELEVDLRSYEIRYEDGVRLDVLLCEDHGRVLEEMRALAPAKTRARLQVVSMDHIERVKAAERAAKKGETTSKK